MTWSSWAAWLAAAVVYLGAFLTGVRPGHWGWSRLWPLAGSLLIFAFAWAQMVASPIPYWWRVSGLATITTSVFLYVTGIVLVVETRDF
jgi:MFS superfamily sulfate permease-like transporter